MVTASESWGKSGLAWKELWLDSQGCVAVCMFCSEIQSRICLLFVKAMSEKNGENLFKRDAWPIFILIDLFCHLI